MSKRSDVCAECRVRFRLVGSSKCWWCAQDISPQDERAGIKNVKERYPQKRYVTVSTARYKRTGRRTS